jgi:cytochrome d ubiquinol oxidase subunit II
VYFMLDGFDFGAGMLRNFLARGETERKMALRSIGPVWNGNEVWLITAGGATFAAFPAVYATMFSLLYLPMLLILFSLIARGVAVEFRSKGESPGWRGVWDWVLAVTSFTAPLVLGLGFGNIFRGLPFDAAGYHGTFGRLFNPYGLLTALLFIVLFLQHGAVWLALRTTGDLAERSRKLAAALWYVVLLAAAGFLVLSAFATGLFGNYRSHPGLLVVPFLAVVALIGVKLWTARGGTLPAFLSSCAAIVLVMASGLIGLFPNLIPSRSDPASSLTAFNSSSGQYTLTVMAIVALVFVPLVIVYQFLVYRFFRAPVTAAETTEEGEGY